MPKSIPLRFKCNGKDVEVAAGPVSTLAEVLRSQLGLTGTKLGCEEGECGACTVVVDGLAVDSCIYPAQKVQGRNVLTVEGLESEGALHPLQTAFVEEGAVQCGYCTPGLLMSAYALLLHKPQPTASDIRRAISGNLCRCTGYVQIVRAVLRASREMQ